MSLHFNICSCQWHWCAYNIPYTNCFGVWSYARLMTQAIVSTTANSFLHQVFHYKWNSSGLQFIPVALYISGPNDSLLNQQMAKNISIYLTESISQINFSLSLKILKGTALCFLHQVALQVYTFLLWGITGCSIQLLITHKIQKLSLHTETLKLQTVPINCL